MNSELPKTLRMALNRADRKTLAAVIRHASARLGAMGGVEGGAKRWKGTTQEQRRAAARKAVMARWARVNAKKKVDQEAKRP